MSEETMLIIDGIFIGFMVALLLMALRLHYAFKDRFFMLFALFLFAFTFSFDNNDLLGRYNFIAGALAAFFFFIALEDMVGFSRSSSGRFDLWWAIYIGAYIAVQIFLTNSEFEYKYKLQRHFLLSLWVPGLFLINEIWKHHRSRPYYLLAGGIVTMLLGVLVNYHILYKNTIDIPLYIGAFSSFLLTFEARFSWHRITQELFANKKKSPKSNAQPSSVWKRLEKMMEQNYENDKFGIPELAKAMNTSRMNLHRQIEAATGLSTSKYMRKYRLEKAKELLQKDKDSSIAEIAYQAGFKSSNYFSQLFKQEFGESPSAFRKK